MTPSAYSFEAWRIPVQSATSVDDLMLVVAAYLNSWPIEDLMRVPVGLAEPIRLPHELADRAVELSHAEIDFRGNSDTQQALSELALVISTAAARLAYLQSPRAKPTKVGLR